MSSSLFSRGELLRTLKGLPLTDKNKQRALVIILIVEAIIIAWLLTRRAALAATGNKSYPLTIQEGPASFTGSPFSVGGLTVSPLDLTLLFPGRDPGPVQSCDCGCDENSPVNVATAQLASFINQYEAGIFGIEKGYVQSLAAAVPDWMSQYINSGGGALGIGGGGNGGL